LVDAIANWPVASGLANDIDQFEERALIPILSDLLNLSARIEGNDVDLRAEVSATPLEMGRGTYNWERNNAIGEEVVVQAGKICAASSEKFEGGVNLYRQSVAAVNHIQKLLLLLLELMALAGKMLEDFGRAIEGDERCNVVERRVVSQERGVWSLQKLPVCSLKRHDDRQLFIRCVLMIAQEVADARGSVVERADP
jgi:hypothetical protein